MCIRDRDTDFPFQFITQIKETIYLIAENDKLARYNFHTKKLKFVDIPYPHHKDVYKRQGLDSAATANKDSIKQKVTEKAAEKALDFLKKKLK